MKYLTYLALVGLINAKTALVIDDQKIVETAQGAQMAVVTELQKPAAQAVAQALESELTQAALKIDMGFAKVMKPVLESLELELEVMSYDEDCKVHEFYQCLVDNGIQQDPWMAYQTTCEEDTDCTIKYYSMTPEEDDEFFDEQDELEDKIEDRAEELLAPIGKSMQEAYIKNAANVA